MTNCCFHGRVLVLFTVLLAFCSSFRCSAPFKYGRMSSVTTSTKSIAVLARTWGNGHGCRSEYELYASKGFGKGGTTGGDSQLARTTPQQAKQVTGSYSKLLSKQSKKFEDMKAAGGQPSNDIYARLKGNEVCWFIGILFLLCLFYQLFCPLHFTSLHTTQHVFISCFNLRLKEKAFMFHLYLMKRH